jgi:bifunctional non-homologous end joining protein LigD
MQVRQPTTRLLKDVPVSYYVFDVLHVDGWSTVGMPYAERRGVLDAIGKTCRSFA